MMGKAVVPVAGRGTRFLTAANASPEEMLPVFVAASDRLDAVLRRVPFDC